MFLLKIALNMKKYIYIVLLFVLGTINVLGQNITNYSFEVVNPEDGQTTSINFNTFNLATFLDDKLKFDALEFPFESGGNNLSFTIQKINSSEHNYDEHGFCQYGDGGFQEPVLITEANCQATYNLPSEYIGSYAVSNLGQLYWIANFYKSSSTQKSFVLTRNIDMTLPIQSYVKVSTWTPIGYGGVFTGTFDGRGHELTNFNYTATTEIASSMKDYYGLFGLVGNCTIKNLKVSGTINIPSTFNNADLCLGLIGKGGGNSTNITDVTSNIVFNIANIPNISNLYIGGILGLGCERNDTRINRCRFSGKFNSSVSAYKNLYFVGGIMGWQRDRNTISNSLFDGTIDIKKCTGLCYAGGISGYMSSIHDKSLTYLKNCLSIGTIVKSDTQGGNYISAIMSTGDGGIITSNNWYRTTAGANFEGNSGRVKNWATPDEQHKLDDTQLYSDGLLTSLGSSNWMKASASSYPVPFYNTSHVHIYNGDGVCTGIDGEYHYEEPVFTDNHYVVKNVGNLYWFANAVIFNPAYAKKNVILNNDIDFKNGQYGSFPGIGRGTDIPYSGTFDGLHHSITNFSMTVFLNIHRIGLFNYVSGGTVKDFNVYGNFVVNSNITNNMYAPVVGEITGSSSRLEDINCYVNISCNANANDVGGIVACASGGAVVNRCRYGGTMTLGTSFIKCAGGVIAEIRKATIKNCLFDGTINSATVNEAIILGGIAGQCIQDGGSSAVSSCFSHGTITIAATTHVNCGAVMGYLTQTLGFTKTYYTNRTPASASLNAVGNKTTVTGITNVTGNSIIYNGDLRIELSDADWAMKDNSASSYPYPEKGGVHTHRYNNGICTADGYYEPAELIDNVYQIKNAGNLFWFKENFKTGGTIAADSKVVLTADIDLIGTSKYPFDGIGSSAYPFSGQFNGQGHTVYNINMPVYSGEGHGFFNYTENAEIRNVKLSGTVQISSTSSNPQDIGSVVGKIKGGSIVEDVISDMNIINTGVQAAQIGGIVGTMFGTSSKINRCTYSGVMTLNEGFNIIGGICGRMEGIVTNNLFNGHISSTSTNTNMILSGLVGKSITYETNVITNNFVDGEISVPSACTNTAMILGCSDKVIVLKNNYYTTTNVTPASLSCAGTYEISVLHVCEEVTNSEEITNGTLLKHLGDGNWMGNAQSYPVPTAGLTHTHTLDNGVCMANDDYYEEPTKDASNVYQIANAGNMWWFANYVNSQSPGNVAVNAKLTNDIQMEGGRYGDFPGIGLYDANTPANSIAYAGTFDGQGYSIIDYFRYANEGDGRTGLFNYIKNATVKKAIVSGSVVLHNSGSISHVGSVVGLAEGTSLVEDIFSSVNMTCNSYVISIGGVVGRAAGTINRCRYNGTLDGKKSANQLGGICGSARSGLTITNCLFDGTIKTASTEKEENVKVGGILSCHDNGYITVERCLSHGTITLPETLPTAYCGIVLGRTDTQNELSVNHNYYTTTNSKLGSATFTQAYGKTKNNTTIGVSQVTNMAELTNGELAYRLSEANWKQDVNCPSPLLGGNGTHIHVFVNGVCTADADGYEQPVLQDGYYQIKNAGNFWWFAQYVMSQPKTATATEGTPVAKNAKLMNSIDMEGNKYGSFPIIGVYGNVYFAGVFDGQGYTIYNYYRKTTSGPHTGLFGYTQGATIKNFKINGNVEVTSGSAQHGTVIGYSFKSTIEDVYSSVNINFNCPNGASIFGGFAGRAGGTYNRCRYDGTITTSANVYDRVGGFCGETKGSAILKNCLFDGKLNVASDNANLSVGGFCGGTGEDNNDKILNCFFNGVMNVSHPTSRCGIVLGCADVTTMTISGTYYTKAGVPASITKDVGSRNGKVTGSATEVTNKKDLTNGELQFLLGDVNWKQDTNYPTPLYGGTGTHTHRYQNGFCRANDGGIQEPSKVGTVYQIANGGNMWWFAQEVNKQPKGETKMNATLLNDINLECSTRGSFPRMANWGASVFAGTFDGNGYTITDYYYKNEGGRSGLFGYATNATIKDFTIEGRIEIGGTDQQHGSIIGYAGSGTTIEDIHSKVNITVTKNVDNPAWTVGGIAGRGGGTINRCRYSGTITGNKAWRRIGGVIGETYGGTTKNCLFDGTITSASTDVDLCVGGIAGGVSESVGNIENCFANGTITVGTTANGSSGYIIGYGETQKTVNITNTYYNKSKISDNITSVNGVATKLSSNTTFKTSKVSAVNTSDVNWASNLHTTLGIENWELDKKIGYPTPGPAYSISTYQELVDFRNLVNSNNGKTLNARLKKDIDCSGNTFDVAIGSSAAYTGTFDGRGYCIKDLNVNVSGSVVGLFGNVGKAEIKDLTVEGQISTSSNNNNLKVGLIAYANLKDGNMPLNVTNVHAKLEISASKATQTVFVGGIMGHVIGNATSPVEVDKCSFVGSISTAGNGYHGGIIGQCQEGYQKVSNCLVNADIKSTYSNSSLLNSKMTYLGGILGSNDNDNFNGVRNCLWISGSLNTSTLKSGKFKVGTIVASDSKNTAGKYSDNCAYLKQGVSIPAGQGTTVPSVTTLTAAGLESGEACALLNLGDNDGNPVWGQVLGNTEDADTYPTPCDVNYVIKDASNNYKADKYILSAGGGELYLPDFTSSSNKCVEAKDLTISAKFVGDGWLPIYVPLRLTFDSWKHDFEVAKIMNFHHYIKKADETHPAAREFVVLEVQKVTKGTLKANHPYLIKAKDNKGTNELTMSLDESNTADGSNRSIYKMVDGNTVTCTSTENKYVFTGNYSDSFAFPEKTGELAGANFYVLYPEDENKAMMESEAAKTKYSKSTSELVPMCSWYMTQTRRSDVELGGTVLYAPQRILVRYSGFDIDELMNDFGEFGEPVDLDDIVSDDVHPVLYITSDGVAHDAPQSGKMNIIKMSDGSFMKVMMK